MSDKDREDLIEAYRLMLVLETDAHFKQVAMLRMNVLIGERSPVQVRAMEMRRGLNG